MSEVAIVWRSILDFSIEQPNLTLGVIIAAGCVPALAVVFMRLVLLAHLDFQRRRYQVRRLGAASERKRVYEEADAEAIPRVPVMTLVRDCLVFVGLRQPRPPATDRYLIFHRDPDETNTDLPSEECWDAEVPPWARGRRSEILARISASSLKTDGPPFRLPNRQ